MDDKVYLVYVVTDFYTDPDAEITTAHLGVAMSEARAKQYVDNYAPDGPGWTRDESYSGEWKGEWILEGDFKTRHAATLSVCYEPLIVL